MINQDQISALLSGLDPDKRAILEAILNETQMGNLQSLQISGKQIIKQQKTTLPEEELQDYFYFVLRRI